MVPVLAVLLWVIAGVLSAALVATAVRRLPQPPWAELGFAGVLLTNLGTTVPMLTDPTATPAPWLLSAAMGAWLVALFTFPDGRPAPVWTGWILLTGLGLVGLAPATRVGDAIGAGVFVAAFSIGVGSQIWRYQRRSTVRERQATKWLLAGLVPAATVFVGIGLIVATTSIDADVFAKPWYEAVSVVAVWLVPVTGTVGLLAGDRGPIDAVVHALIVLTGSVTGIAWVYFAAVPAVGPTWAAAIAAVLVLPVHALLRRLATRVVYTADQPSPVALLGQRLESSVSAQDVAVVVARTIANALALPHVTVRLDGRVAATVGDDGADGAPSELEGFAVQYLGVEVAEILVAPRSGDVALAGRDRDALARLAATAGPALHGAATLRELSLARERLVITREEERRRLRRDLHDDLAPTLAGLSMRVAAAAALGSIDPARAQRLQTDVQNGLQAAIAQIRQVAYDLRPPVLDDQGLEMAIRDRLATAIDPKLQVDVDVHDLPSALPAAVELAALRIVQEAVTNVRRHARANSCRVALACDGRHLSVEVEDDGCGLASEHVRGLGLRSIDERAAELGGTSRTEAKVGGGTLVSVLLPLREAETW
jgi:signal transduction histidine kinase